MKKAVKIALTAVLLLANAAVLQAKDSYMERSNRKLGRGVANVVFGGLEVFKGIETTYEESNWIGAATWGPIRGGGNAIRRIGKGAFETATFMVPSDTMEKPEFVMPNSSPNRESPLNENDPLLKA